MKKTMRITPTRGFMQMASGVVYKQVPSWYGGDNRALTMNIIRRPSDGPAPLIVYVIGGSWQEVSKAVGVPDLVYLVEAGFTVASIEYRSIEKGLFPAQIEDVKAAIRYLRANAERWNIDPEHVGIMGDSAGGHLAALAGVTNLTREFDVGDNLEESSAVDAVCDWFGPADFTVEYSGSGELNAPESLLIGASVTHDTEKALYASPVNYVSPQTPPFLIIHGLRDGLVPFEQSEILYQKLIDNGVEADLVGIEDADHGDPRFATSIVRKEILSFFEKHLKGKVL